MTVSIEIKRKLSEILKVSVSELDAMIEDIKKTHNVSDVVAVIQLLTRSGLIDIASDIVEELLFRTNICNICELKIGMRGVTIVGRVDLVKLFDEPKGKNVGLVVVYDDTGMAQVNVQADADMEDTLKLLRIGDIVIMKGINVIGRYKSGIYRLVATKGSLIRRVDDGYVRKLIGRVPKAIQTLEISDIEKIPMGEFRYIHVRGVVMKVLHLMGNGNARTRRVSILLGDTRDYCRKRIICNITGRAIDELMKLDLRVGDVVVIHGAYVREYGERRVISVRNLGIIEKLDPHPVKVSDVGEGGWWLFKIKVRSRARLGVYRRDSVEHRYATLLGESDGEMVRLVVWNEDLVDIVAGVKPYDMISVFGQVRRGIGSMEIHVQPNMGAIVHLGSLREDVSGREMGVIYRLDELLSQHIDSIVNVLLFVKEVQKVSRKRLDWVVVLSDGISDIKLLVWSDGVLDDLDDIAGCLVKIRNVRIMKRKDGEGIILATTKQTKIDVLVRGFNFWGSGEKISGTYTKIKDVAVGSKASIWGVIVKIEWIGIVRLCRVCGGFIVDAEKAICELGHTGGYVEVEMVSARIDDGLSAIDVLIPLSLLGVERGDFVGMEELSETLSGKPICLSGTLRLDYSSSPPTKVFIVDELCRGYGVEYFLSILRNRMGSGF